ncbi:osteopontin [Ornithorhynchus anatinus]|uniref:Secreted phosphoprotein 1 n=1 Tax=Ornithorhynchus anatinus TaxID=9258 RepID=A0A6I8NZT1_ORNAN|nr:osteopontin [Ornithorhynchus anatinus]
MRTAVICLCLISIACALPVKRSGPEANSGSSEEKQLYNKHPNQLSSWLNTDPSQKQALLAPQNLVSSEESKENIQQQTLPSISNESHDDVDDADDQDDSDHKDESDDSDESDEVVTDFPTDVPATAVFTPAAPTRGDNGGRGDRVYRGLKTKPGVLYKAAVQGHDASDDFTSRLESLESDESPEAYPDAHKLQKSSEWHSNEASHQDDRSMQKSSEWHSSEASHQDDRSVETHSHEEAKGYRLKQEDHSSQQDDLNDSQESYKVSRENDSQEKTAQDADSDEFNRKHYLKSHTSHEFDSASSETH